MSLWARHYQPPSMHHRSREPRLMHEPGVHTPCCRILAAGMPDSRSSLGLGGGENTQIKRYVHTYPASLDLLIILGAGLSAATMSLQIVSEDLAGQSASTKKFREHASLAIRTYIHIHMSMFHKPFKVNSLTSLFVVCTLCSAAKHSIVLECMFCTDWSSSFSAYMAHKLLHTLSHFYLGALDRRPQLGQRNYINMRL